MPDDGSTSILSLAEANRWLAQRQEKKERKPETVSLTPGLDMGGAEVPLNNAFLKAHAYYALFEDTENEDAAFDFLNRASNGGADSKTYKFLKNQARNNLEAVLWQN